MRVSFNTVASLHRLKNASLHRLLENCSSSKHLAQIHAQVVVRGLAADDDLTLGKLISCCAAADLRYARLAFDRVPEPNRFMYNTLIRGYSIRNCPDQSLSLYRTMVNRSLLSPNEFTLPFVLKACAAKSAFWAAIAVHCQAIKLGFGSHVCVQNALVNVYVVYELIRCARQVFDEIPDRTLVSWNTMIGGYSRFGCCGEAYSLFREMRDSGVRPDKYTLVNLLLACSQSCDLDFGRHLHGHIEVSGVEIDRIVTNSVLDMYAKCRDLRCAKTVFDRMSDKNVVSWTSMVSGYAKNGDVKSAREVFDRMPVKNVVSWNAMLSCYVREGLFKEAIDLFREMCSSDTVPDETTLVSVLTSCSQIGDLTVGKETHKYIRNSNSNSNSNSDSDTPLSVTLSNSLIDMYAKCGALDTAIDLFLETPRKNVVTWNVIIGGLASHGRGLEAIEKFEEMRARGIRPDKFTFTGLLLACSHSGLVEIGRRYFRQMGSLYTISPELEHYACVVDILGRGGLLEESVRVIANMPVRPDIVVWGALLGACRIHGNVEIGKHILKQLLELEPRSSGLYVLLSNIFSEARRWEDVKKLRKLMKDGGVVKSRAISFITVNGCVYEFMADDQRPQISTTTYVILDQLSSHSRPVSDPYTTFHQFALLE